MRTILCSIGLFVSLALARAQPFTFQGFLRQNGQPVTNNALSMTFKLFTASSGGPQVGPTLTQTVNVQNGLFTVELDFGNVWGGGPRYLEIQVGSTVLTPRVKINPTPYASTLRMFESGTTNPDRMVITHSPPFTNWGLQYRDSDDTFHFLAGGISRMRIGLSDGFVGIGTATPAYALDVSGDVRWTGTLQGGSVPWARITGAPSFLSGSGTANRIALFTAANTLGDSVITQSGSNIGIGTTSPAYLVDIRAADRNARLLNISNTNTGATADGIWVTVAGSSAWGIRAEATGTDGYAVTATASGTNGIAVRGIASGTNAFAGYFVGRGYFSGDVGIGTSPAHPLHVVADRPSGIGVYSRNTGVGVKGESTNNDGVVGESTAAGRSGVYAVSGNINGYGLFAANYGTGTGPRWAGYFLGNVRVEGTARVNVLEIAGADFAEKFPTTDPVQPGMVVEIDPNNPGNLRLARGAYNKRVAGIVAGANGLSKGIVLGNTEGSERHAPIAISGRVWVYADATEHAIEPGDFLTTAERPGYAMKATDLQQAQGAILGKAMTRLEKGQKGFVLVLVNLQ